MSLQLFCNRTDGSKFFSRTTLFVIIYGPMEIFDDVGEYCRQHDAYLQDPIGCDRDVPYRNPHRLDGLDENASTTYQLIAQKGVKEEVVREQVDILAGLEFDEDLPEAEAPAALWTQLYPHQKQALAFMQKRERSWDFKSLRRDLWGIDQDRLGAITFVNNITLDTQYEQPPDFRGGILADQMGLGKSLTIISLIASDFDVEDVGPGSPFPKRVSESDAEDQNSVRATLLVVPPSLLQSWETQLRTHVRRKTLRWFRHHETSKIQNASELRRYEIVMTTFPTISSEFRKRNFADSILFKTRWHRIVLDEAHCIRNFKTTMAKAVCELSARARWALTGTPLQNRLADFASLLRFLRVYPYDDPKMFQIDIINVLKSQGEDIAVGRVKKLIKFIMIRRTQSAIKLPKKTDQVVKLHFTPSELSRYKQAESPIAAMIDDALNSTAQQSGIFIHALARINALRKFCNIGSTASLKEVTSPMFQQPQNLQADISTAQERYDNLVSLGQSSCVVCSSNLEASNVEGLCVGTQSGQAYLTSCMVLLCEACYTEGKESVCSCESPTTCVPEAVITNRALSVPASPASEIFFQDGFPTKIKALGEDLKSSLDEKSVVFSSWTTTLDFVRKMLDKERIPYVQVDGRVPPRKRIAAFDEFRNRQNIKVVLLTIACGAEGLDLTAASRVYLLEPQWNPSVEEQALARIHRLGQKRTVTTIRFAMKDSIEDHVLGIQDRKKHLADLLLSQSQNSTSQQEIAREKLQRLRSLLD
ncbi:SNF2 family N-terminal domain-containing protein [Lineolata rhizophorae]|uniref:SNF2 family N-terminal domain-containing protein n=1 Tax=Lineolata rhizophorae TaxID=578093 RepID=A0A6A6P4U7_9PEZI|nr:SNF2 family N-terminal domain-containing protein [Lineolata rhizophorae]